MYVAKEIEQYQATKREIVNIEKDILYGSVTGTSHGHSDVVATKATALVAHKSLQQMRNFVDAFEDTFNKLPKEKQKMIELLYWSNRELNCNGVGIELNVDGSTIGRWRMAILSRIAERMGLK